MIYLVDPDDGTSVEVDETLFANLLADQDVLRLVVLNSCEGARTTLTDPYAGVATTLVQLGVPAVVAMQFEISDRAAIVFAEELYTNLIGRRDPIDAAVAEARKAIYSDVDRVEWATPVLFVRDPDVQLFRFAPAPAHHRRHRRRRPGRSSRRPGGGTLLKNRSCYVPTITSCWRSRSPSCKSSSAGQAGDDGGPRGTTRPRSGTTT